MEILKKIVVSGGVLHQCKHKSSVVKTDMKFSVFIPPQASFGKVPVLYYLSGLTCTDANFTEKGAAYKQAAARGIAFVAPDTSPRRETALEGENDSYDFGSGAGFYLNATQAPWNENYNMYTYVTEELPKLVNANFPINPAAQGITGHSMGGHGALTIGLKNPDKYRSVSAFSPICNPINCDWGKKAFNGYLGEDQATWKDHDATELMKSRGSIDAHILIDQGTADNFYPHQLLPDNFEEACKAAGQKLTCRRQEGYDHSYFFISSFVDDHINHHADSLLVSKV